LPLNVEGESVEAAVNVSVKTAVDIAAEGARSDSISASEVADDPDSAVRHRRLGVYSAPDIRPGDFATLVDLINGQGGNRTADTRIFSPLLYRLSYLAKFRCADFRPDSTIRPPSSRSKQRAATDSQSGQRGNIAWSYRQGQLHRSFKVCAGQYSQAFFEGRGIPNKIHRA
jgi:hypothetical protein